MRLVHAATRAALIAALLGALVALPACGASDDELTRDQIGALVWTKQPLLVTPENLPKDRILAGEIRNDSMRELRLRAKDIRIVDGNGKPMRGNVIFIDGYSHPLAPFDIGPDPSQLPDKAAIRLGYLAKLEPGRSTPVNVSWREPAAGRGTARLEYNGGILPIPSK
jgi:hypothetical protein